MVVGFPGVGAEISREQTATGSDHITANMDWSKEDCKILPQLAHAAKDAKLPGGFPNFEGLDKRVDDCSGNMDARPGHRPVQHDDLSPTAV